MNPAPDWRKLAWHHGKFRVPADWEITSYAIEERIGRLEFSTRRGFVALVGWEPCKQEPDRETTMLAFLQRQAPAAGAEDKKRTRSLVTRTVGAFLIGHQDDARPCQALGYLPEQKTLIRWVFASAGGRLIEEVAVPILSSFEPNAGSLREYAVFGFDLRLPKEFELEQMAVYPANVMLAFESRAKARATFRRWGLPEVVLDGRSLPDFYAGFLARQHCRVSDVQPARFRGMDAARAAYRQRPERQMERCMGRFWRNGEAWLWHNREEQRLYAFEQIGPRRAPPLPIESVFA